MLKYARERFENTSSSIKRQASGFALDSMLRGLARLGKLHPLARPSRHGIEVIENVAYQLSGRQDHWLDIYRPTHLPDGKAPVVLYIHGGGFRILSKDTHWLMGLMFARAGYVVFNINYRLAPKNPFPAAVHDACAAYEWMVANAAHYGGDLGRLIIAGESAGGNLALVLAICSHYRRPEPCAKRIYATGVRPKILLPACPMVQVSNPDRFFELPDFPRWVKERVVQISRAYLHNAQPCEGGFDLADPLLFLERGEQPLHALPPTFTMVGSKDPLFGDTKRLQAALEALGVPVEACYFDGEIHAFHALMWRQAARDAWQRMLSFTARALDALD
jgi:acetyl esterase